MLGALLAMDRGSCRAQLLEGELSFLAVVTLALAHTAIALRYARQTRRCLSKLRS